MRKITKELKEKVYRYYCVNCEVSIDITDTTKRKHFNFRIYCPKCKKADAVYREDSPIIGVIKRINFK